jgi:hypothetical protein
VTTKNEERGRGKGIAKRGRKPLRKKEIEGYIHR